MGVGVNWEKVVRGQRAGHRCNWVLGQAAFVLHPGEVSKLFNNVARQREHLLQDAPHLLRPDLLLDQQRPALLHISCTSPSCIAFSLPQHQRILLPPPSPAGEGTHSRCRRRMGPAGVSVPMQRVSLLLGMPCLERRSARASAGWRDPLRSHPSTRSLGMSRRATWRRAHTASSPPSSHLLTIYPPLFRPTPFHPPTRP